MDYLREFQRSARTGSSFKGRVNRLERAPLRTAGTQERLLRWCSVVQCSLVLPKSSVLTAVQGWVRVQGPREGEKPD